MSSQQGTLSVDAPRGVLIVGAGPTGLALANALAHYGIPFTIVDRKSGPGEGSKGLTISVGTQYALGQIGLNGLIGKNGFDIRRADIFWMGERFSSINFGNLKLPMSSLIAQPQPHTEFELLEALHANGFDVAWNTTLVNIEASPDGVKASFDTDTGTRITRVYDYAAGCEGKHSIVRDSIEAVLSGHDYSKYLVLGDFPVPPTFLNKDVSYHVYDDTFFILIPIGGGLLRVVVKYEGDAPNTEIAATEITSIVNRHMGEAFLSENPVWLSRAQLYMRVSDKLRKGRLFIAGDAAHLVSPIGGTGFNMGIQDAINLAWKIAFHYLGYSDDAIFDAYETERLEVIRETVAAADRSTRILTGSYASEEAVDAMRPVMKNRNNFRSTFPFTFSGLGIRYSKCYSHHNKSALPGARLAGEFCFGRETLVQILEQRTGHIPRASVIVAVHLDENGATEQHQWLRVLTRIVGTYPALSPIVVMFDPENTPIDAYEQMPNAVFAPVNRAEANKVGIVAGAMLVVMPDGYVVFSGRLSDAADIEKILLSILALRTPSIAVNNQASAVRNNRSACLSGDFASP